jgi:hypothetical protein
MELHIGVVELAGESGINTRKQTIKSSPETPTRPRTKFT